MIAPFCLLLLMSDPKPRVFGCNFYPLPWKRLPCRDVLFQLYLVSLR